MTNEAVNEGRRGWNPWRVIGWGTVAVLLVLPLVAMQFTAEVNWTAGDFLFAALLMGSVGLAYELTVRATRSWAYRGGIAVALAAAFLTVWANGAVGMIGSEDNPYNLLFLGVILLALAGAALAGFGAGGMALAMAAAGAAQAALGIYGAFSDLRGGILATGFAAIWLVAAGLFRNAASEQSRPDEKR